MKAHHDNCITLFENFLDSDLYRLKENYLQLDALLQLGTDMNRLCEYLSCSYNLPEDHEIYKLVENVEDNIMSGQRDAVILSIQHLINQLIDFAG